MKKKKQGITLCLWSILYSQNALPTRELLSLLPGMMHGGDDVKIVVIQDESFHVPHLVETFPLDFLERTTG
jgi:hypothetical protein